jgi:hypothetical protein
MVYSSCGCEPATIKCVPIPWWLQEVGDLRKTLSSEVEGLRSEFLDLKSALKQQLELTAGLASQVCILSVYVIASVVPAIAQRRGAHRSTLSYPSHVQCA